MKKSVTVVGSGIVGLTTAIILQENNFKVSLLAKDTFDKTLSSKVGAIWFPFEVAPAEQTNHWGALSYKRYQQEQHLDSGISFIDFITDYTANTDTTWTKRLPKGTVRKATQEELPKGMKMAYISKVPLAEPPKYLPYLFKKFISNGGNFSQKIITSLEEMAELDDLVVNCTGLGARELCNDNQLYPIRGQILRCQKMEIPSFAKITEKGALTYVINRSNDSIIGGTDYENDWNKLVEKSDTELIINRFRGFELLDGKPKILNELVGLRPKRSSVRFEFDEHYPTIFHNYGHGGAGFTVAWGCAIELAKNLS